MRASIDFQVIFYNGRFIVWSTERLGYLVYNKLGGLGYAAMPTNDIAHLMSLQKKSNPN